MKDLEAQDRFGVRYLSWWFNPHARSVCCLIDAPDAQAAWAVHMEAHGTTADKLIQVERDVVEAFLGGGVDAGLGRMVVQVTELWTGASVPSSSPTSRTPPASRSASAT